MAEIVYPQTLITEEYLKAYSPLPTNYNLNEIKQYIHVSEILWVVPIIGDPLYQKLLDEVEEDNVPEEDATLLLKIYPLLGNATVYEALPFVSYHISEVGITRGKSDNSDSIETKDVNFISNHLRSQIEVLKAELKKFLDENADLYPDYYPEKDKCDCGGKKGKFDPTPYFQVYTTKRKKVSLR